MMKRHHSIWAAILLMFCAALALSSCDGGSKSGSDDEELGTAYVRIDSNYDKAGFIRVFDKEGGFEYLNAKDDKVGFAIGAGASVRIGPFLIPKSQARRVILYYSVERETGPLFYVAEVILVFGFDAEITWDGPVGSGI
jgi:hypothetical protein